MEESKKEIEKEIEKEMEKKVESWVTEVVPVGITILITVAITSVITVVVLKLVWAWVVPDLFPGAVDQGLISSDLTWLAAIKLAVLAGVLGGVNKTLSEAFKRKK